jgi:hypothetical protein
MFHWICPECGREIPPTMKECAACDPKAQPAPIVPAPVVEPAPDPLLALAEQIRFAQAEVKAAQMQPVENPELVTAAVNELAVAVGLAKPEPALLTAAEVKAAPPPAMAAATTLELPTPVELAPKRPAPEPVPGPGSRGMTDLLPNQPPAGSRLQLAPLQDYTAAATKSMRPAPPRREILSRDSGPRVTLPGPTLPADLVSLKSAGVVTVIGGPRPPKRLPGWVVSGMLMLGIPLAAGALLLYIQPLQHSSADAKGPAAAPPPATVAAPVEPSHSLADFVEVSGFRFVVDFNKKSEIHYLAVNHSGAELSDMTVYVTLHAADAKAGQPPLCRFSFRTAGLGPFESKEMISTIEKLSRTMVLPDWHDLRADVQIGQ